MQRLLTVAEAAELLRVSQPAVRALTRRPHRPLPAVKIGRGLMVVASELDPWLAAEAEAQRTLPVRR